MIGLELVKSSVAKEPSPVWPSGMGAVAEWVRLGLLKSRVLPLNWRPGGPGIESRCGNVGNSG